MTAWKDDSTQAGIVAGTLGVYGERAAGSRAVASAVHRAAAYLAERHPWRAPTDREITDARHLIGSSLAPTPRQAMRTAVLTLLSVYVSRYWIPAARLVASELVLGSTAADLVWLRRDGRLIIHELKTDMFAGPAHPPTVAQAQALCAEASERFAGAFAGVHVLMLRRPADSFLLAPRDRGRAPSARSGDPGDAAGRRCP